MSNTQVISRMTVRQNKLMQFIIPVRGILEKPLFQGYCFFKILYHLNWIEEDDVFYNGWSIASELLIKELLKAKNELEPNTTAKVKVYNCILGIMSTVKLNLSGVRSDNRYWLPLFISTTFRMNEILKSKIDIYSFDHINKTIHCVNNMKISNWLSFHFICHSKVEFVNYKLGYDGFYTHEIYKKIKQNPCMTYGQAIDLPNLVDNNGRVATDLKKHLRYLISLKFGIEVAVPHIGKERRIRFSRWAELVNEIVPIKPKAKAEAFFYEPEYFEATRKLQLINDIKTFLNSDDHANNIQTLKSPEVLTSTTDVSAVEKLKELRKYSSEETIKHYYGGFKDNEIRVIMGNVKYRAKYIFRDTEIGKFFLKTNKKYIFYREVNQSHINQILNQPVRMTIDNMPFFNTQHKLFIIKNGVVYFTMSNGESILKKTLIDESIEIVKPRKLKPKRDPIRKIGNELANILYDNSTNNLKKILETEEHWKIVKEKSKKPVYNDNNFIHANRFEALPVFRKTEFKLRRNIGIDNIKKTFEPPKLSSIPNVRKKQNKSEKNKRDQVYSSEDNKKELQKRQSKVDKFNNSLEKSVVKLSTLDFIRSRLFSKNNNALYRLNDEAISTAINFNYVKKSQLSMSHTKRKKFVEIIKHIATDSGIKDDRSII